MYTFFQKYLDNPGDSSDVEVKLLHGKELQVIKTGQVSSLKGESIFSLNYKEAERKKNKLQLSRKNNPEYFSEILQAARKLSGYQEPKPQEPVFTGRIQKEGYVIEKYFVKGDGDYVIPYLVMKPERPGNKALIYLDPAGKSSGAAEGGEMEWFVKNGFTVLAPDLIGTGEMGPGVFKGDSYISVNSYNLWFASMLIGRSIVGIRAGDVVKLTRMLKKNYGMPEVYGLAKKEMAPVLLHAASFDNVISRVALIEPYTSYQSIVMNRIYNPAFIQNAVPGSLGVYDLPDLAASLAPRKLMMAGITDGTGNKINPESASEELSVIKGAYHNRNAEAQLQIISWKPNENLYESYVRWINN
jgi:hypothetical protein